jgi:23S rRNA pseudouridine1911/1915/1917 synthase
VEPPTADPGVPFEVRWEDEWVAVVAKPPGVVVHPGTGQESQTLVHGLLARYPQIEDVGDRMRPGIVHRLDRDTSGLMVVALRQEAYETLVEALAARRVTREYLALVWGHPEPARGVVDAPVGRSERNRTRMAVTPSGREARTAYHVVESFERTSLLELSLETGRTHQIRVHLAAIGHHVVGDPVYGGNRGVSTAQRPFLHARRLRFDHPVTGEAVDVSEPLPDDLERALARERGG